MSSFVERAFWRSDTVAYVILDALYMSKLNQSWSIILIVLMLLMRIVLSFVWSEFSSVGREEWCNKMKNGQKLKLGDAHASPLHQQKYQVIFQCAIFLLLHILCVILRASLFLFTVFFSFIFVLFAVINGWTPSFLVLEETHSVLIA